MPHATTRTDTYSLPLSAAPANHGTTTAAWVMCWSIALGLLVATVAFVLEHWWLVGLGALVIVGGLAASLALRLAGKGQPIATRQERDWYED